MSRIAVSLLFLAACGAPQEQRGTTLGPPSATPTTAEAAQDEEVCTEERTTGTMITHTVCRSPAQIEQERRAAEQLRRDSAMHPDGKIRK